MEGIIAIIMVFGMPIAIVGLSKYFKFRTRKLELEAHRAPESEERLAQLEGDKAQLQQRVENLETIVTSVDLELNARLSRLAAHQSQLALGAAPDLAAVAEPARSAAGGGGSMVDTAAATLPPGTADSAATVARAQQSARAWSGELAVGSVLLERFEVQELIGRGGMGAVYRAQDRQLGETVALKVIASNLVEDPEAAGRFKREVGAARRISHPNVIRIHDLGEDDGLLFLSMEYFAGRTLQQLLQTRGALPPYEAFPLLAQVGSALSEAHRVGVVHRDLKPLNILVNASAEVRVIDFGLAKASYMRSMTATGLIMGTPEYMAPEQVRGEEVDNRTDVYALAAVSYHAVCGRPPFVGDTPISIGFKQCTEAPPSPAKFAVQLSEGAAQALLRGLEKRPADRFASVDAFVEALRA